MTAASKNRYGERQPSDLCPYNGASGYTYYKNTLQMNDIKNGRIIPVVQGTGSSHAAFIGVADNMVDLEEGLGASQRTLNIWKTGEFTFVANGTGASAHIGQKAYALDDQTVGVSIDVPCLQVGEIVGVPSTSSYRVRIDNAIAVPLSTYGVSYARPVPPQN